MTAGVMAHRMYIEPCSVHVTVEFPFFAAVASPIRLCNIFLIRNFNSQPKCDRRPPEYHKPSLFGHNIRKAEESDSGINRIGITFGRRQFN